MTVQAEKTQIDLPGAAMLLGMTWHEAYAHALSGRLGELARCGGRYLLDRATVERMARERSEALAAGA
jgi:hypothetical protein